MLSPSKHFLLSTRLSKLLIGQGPPRLMEGWSACSISMKIIDLTVGWQKRGLCAITIYCQLIYQRSSKFLSSRQDFKGERFFLILGLTQFFLGTTQFGGHYPPCFPGLYLARIVFFLRSIRADRNVFAAKHPIFLKKRDPRSFRHRSKRSYISDATAEYHHTGSCSWPGTAQVAAWMKVQRENLRLTAEQWTVKVCARHVTYARTAPLELLRRPTQRFMSNSCISPHNTEAQKPERRFTPDLSNLYNSDRGGGSLVKD